MRRRERRVGKERLVCFPRPALDKSDHCIGKHFAGELPGHPWRRQRPVGRQVTNRHLGVVGHPSNKHRLAVLERPDERVGPVVPFAGPEGDIATASQDIGHQWHPREVHWNTPQRSATHQHRATRLANSPVSGPHAIGSAETESAVDQAVNVRRADVRVAVGGYRIGPLIVGEQEQDVWPALRFSGTAHRHLKTQAEHGDDDGRKANADGRTMHSELPRSVEMSTGH